MGSRRRPIAPPINRRVIEGAEHLVTGLLLLVLAGIVVATYLSLLRPGTGGSTALPATTTTAAAEVLGVTITTAPPAAEPTTATTAPPAAVPTCQAPVPPPAEGTMLVQVAYPCPGARAVGGLSWVARRVPASELVLTATVGEMVKGPTATEQDAGFRSYWSTETADAVTALRLSDGVAYVDVEPMPPGIPETPDAGAEWLSATAGTVFQFSTIRSLELRTDGDCDAFWRTIGGTDCVRLDRTRWSRQLASWREATSGPPESRG